MFVKYAKIKGCKRLSHNNIREIHVDFSSKFQMLIGTNGSGKSTLLRLFAFYPAHKELFTPDGYREVCMERHGTEWTLIDDFSTGKHKLIKDGELYQDNLNPTMCKQLFLELFGIDQLIVDILTDKKCFTELSPNDRREIIMRASGINVELGINMINKFKERKTYYKEFTKNLSKRLIAEEQNIPTASHVENLKQQKEDILHDLSLLDEMIMESSQVELENDIYLRLVNTQNEGKTIAYKLVDTPKDLYTANDREGAIEIALRLKYDLEGIEKRKKEISELIDSKSKLVGSNRFSKSLDDVEKELELVNKQIDAILKGSKDFLYEGNDVRNVVNNSKRLYEFLLHHFDQLPDNCDRRFNAQQYTAVTEQMIRLNNAIRLTTESLNEVEYGLKLHKDGERVECPACSNNFIPGVSLSETTLKEDQTRLNLELSKRGEQLEKLKVYAAEYQKYMQTLTSISELLNLHPQHEGLQHKLVDYGYTHNPVSGVSMIIEDWAGDMNRSVIYNEHLERRTQLEREKKLISSEDLERKKILENEITTLEKEYSDLISESSLIKTKMGVIKEYITYVDNLGKWIGKAETLQTDIAKHLENKLKQDINTMVKQCKSKLTHDLRNLENEISSIEYNILNRDRLVKEKEEADSIVEYLDILQNELSTKTGYLGEVMDEFIGKFVTQMNNYIKTVWTYDVKIFPCRNKKGDLDFYFPIQINNGVIAPDVSETSKGEGHICNFAFKLLVMVTYGLEDFPLYLDELAGNMDPIHRVKIMRIIYEMVANGNTEQMFLISHYDQQHGTFPNAEVLVPNADNLQTIPENYNVHAKII